MKSIKQQIFEYARNTYRVEPDYPFPVAPNYPVLRHADNRKLFARIMDVPRNRLGLGRSFGQAFFMYRDAALSMRRFVPTS